jgi:glutaminyl-peptide cyclotransferase
MNNFQLLDAQRVTSFMPLALALAVSTSSAAPLPRAETTARENFLRYEIVATHPHDVAAFTQGLAFHQGRLIESTGLHGRSAVTIRGITDGAVQRRRPLDASHFGEGLALAGERLLQLTWHSGLALAYDLWLQPAGEFRYAGEGWGLAFDGEHWLMSDGTSRIRYRSPRDFSVIREVRVSDGGRPVSQLNELEFAEGRLYANVWRTDRIAVIEPASGAVQAWLDLAPLRKGFARPAGWDEAAHVLNGIAFNPDTKHFYVTGKCWPVLYEIRLLAAGP